MNDPPPFFWKGPKNLCDWIRFKVKSCLLNNSFRRISTCLQVFWKPMFPFARSMKSFNGSFGLLFLRSCRHVIWCHKPIAVNLVLLLASRWINLLSHCRRLIFGRDFLMVPAFLLWFRIWVCCPSRIIMLAFGWWFSFLVSGLLSIGSKQWEKPRGMLLIHEIIFLVVSEIQALACAWLFWYKFYLTLITISIC